MIKKRYMKRIMQLIILLLLGITIWYVFLRSYSKGGSMKTLEVPEWLNENIDIVAQMPNQQQGPVIRTEESSYEIIYIKIYDVQTDQLITDRDMINSILDGFIYTDNKFVYANDNSPNGSAVFYYDGLMPENVDMALFSGYVNNAEISYEDGKQINSFFLKISSSSIEGDRWDSVEDALKGEKILN